MFKNGGGGGRGLSALTRWRSGFSNIGGLKTFLPTHPTRLHGTRSEVFRTDTTFCDKHTYLLVFQLLYTN